LKKRAQHIDFRGLLLAILMLFAFGAKELHHVFEHQHQEVKVCHAVAGEKHLHNHEYIHHECQLCDFTFSAFETPVLLFQLASVKQVFVKRVFTYQSFILSRSYLFQSLRAPPVAV
jgi:hypothetical protein